jgi:cell division protein FtsW
VASRIDRFLNPEAHDTFQVDVAIQGISQWRADGTGPGGGSAKKILPDAHTDFIPAVIGEEFGFLAIAILICIIGFIVLRVLRRASQVSDPFVVLSLTGLHAVWLAVLHQSWGEPDPVAGQGHDACHSFRMAAHH